MLKHKKLIVGLAPSPGFWLIVFTIPAVVGYAKANAPRISLFAPIDGGTPRAPERIEVVRPGEFRIRACAEEGPCVLTHAVSRVDLVCRNDDAESQAVTLYLDLSGDGQRTNLDNNPFGGMPTRDYVFIQLPGQPWRRIDGSVSGWICTVRFSSPPGESKVGLSPWYTYGDYLRFVQTLPSHPHLKKTLLGASDGGREHWELAITDPNGPAKGKRTIFWHAREHAYETFSSYAIEGLVAHLLSDAASDARRRYQFVLHPMTNVDGVAQGYEYRTGYDFPQPRGTATARMTFDAVDRLRPHFAVTWHNWIAPRDVDCLFYTDSENGKASRRAWDLFTQRFPSPRGVGHRWESEANPLAKNWFGRSPLNESNVHQYAMKRYGTRVWGWEMPWWGRDEGDPAQNARKAGADFGRAFVATLDAIEAGAKFAANDPDKTADGQAYAESVDSPVPGQDAGPILIDPDYPHSFRYQSGARFFPMGDTAYYLVGQPKDVIAHYIDVRREHKFNFVRMMAMAEGNWPFGGNPKKPDYTVIDETAMRKLDWVFDYAAGKGMNIELIVWGYGVEGGEGLWAHPGHQNLWTDTLVHRYKDRPNLLMYTVANEFERYPDGAYSYSPSDVQWAKEVAARIRRVDKVHPVGVHPSHWITEDQPYVACGGFTQRRPQVVWPLWETGPVNLNITQNNEGVQRRTWGDFGGARRGLTYYPTTWQGVDYPATWTATGWDFEGAGMEDSMAEDWAHGKPVLNTEFGYQYEPGGDSGFAVQTRQAHQPSSVRKKAWKIATAGGYFAMGFTSTAVVHFSSREVDNFRPGQLETLYDFFTTRTQYWKMAPHLELVASHNALLALPGREYVAYFPRGGTNSIDLAAGTYAVQWLRPETGQYHSQPGITTADGSRQFTPPEDPDADWVLHLKEK